MRVYSGDEPLTSEERERLRETLLADRGPAYVPWLIREFGPYGGLFMSQVLFWDGKGVLEEDKRGLPRRLYYRADLRALMDIKSGEANVGEEAHASEEGSTDPAYTETIRQRVLQRPFREKTQKRHPCRGARIENSRTFSKKKKKK